MVQWIIHVRKERKPIRNWMLVSSIYAIVIIIFMGIVFLLPNKKQESIENYFIKYSDATTLVEVKYDYSKFFGYKHMAGFINDHSYEKYKNGTYEKDTIKIYHPYIKGKSSIISTDSIISMYKITNEYMDHYYPPQKYTK